eukprot:m.187899 g.187899  ORF g.187899 m.187899 type:complete len:84 (+) comp15073_c0_seq4:3620-3871(+)
MEKHEKGERERHPRAHKEEEEEETVSSHATEHNDEGANVFGRPRKLEDLQICEDDAHEKDANLPTNARETALIMSAPQAKPRT